MCSGCREVHVQLDYDVNYKQHDLLVITTYKGEQLTIWLSIFTPSAVRVKAIIKVSIIHRHNLSIN